MTASSIASARALTALGVRRPSGLDARILARPAPRDVIEMRMRMRRWGVPSFARWPMLLRALTHPSVSFWAARALGVPPSRLAADALAFVGDRAVALAVAPRRSETLLGNSGFSMAAARMGIPDLLCCFSGHQNEPGTLATAYEAVAGAVYLDGGISATRAFVQTTLLSQSAEVSRANMHLGPSIERLRCQIVSRHGTGLALELINDDEKSVDDRPSVGPPEQTLRRVILLARPAAGLDDSLMTSPVVVSHGQATSLRRALLDAVQNGWEAFERLPPAGGCRNRLLDELSRTGPVIAGTSSVPELIDHLPSILATDPRPLAPSRSAEQRDRARLQLERVWSRESPLSLRAVHECLNRSLQADTTGKLPTADEVCAVVTSAIRAISRDLTSLSGLAAYADVGHRVYWLWMSESAFHAVPDGYVAEMQQLVLMQDGNRSRLASVLGGTNTTPAPLSARPCGKLMMFVVLGIVYQRFGIETAVAWLQGAHQIMKEQSTEIG